MKKHTYYTAIGHFMMKREADGTRCPVILINRKEHLMDAQEMALWTTLSWRFLTPGQLEHKYTLLSRELRPGSGRSLEACLNRLRTRGLVASGSGDSDIAALYDLVAGLYVVPLSIGPGLRLISFVKLLFQGGMSLDVARTLFQWDKRDERERQVMALSRQALLSTAELVKCAEVGVRDLSSDRKIMEALYNDDHSTSDNMQYMMLHAESRNPVTLAVANLYLRRQIIFTRV